MPLQPVLSKRIEKKLRNTLPKDSAILSKAIRYAVLNGGKRLRPLWIYHLGLSLSVPLTKLDAPAFALECIHTYSLIHDDLPAMDNDDFRRGKPTCHKKFNEAIAILAGDALQDLAFGILATTNALSPRQKTQMIRILSNAAYQMAQGQVIDIAGKKSLSIQQYQTMYAQKTGALFEAATEMVLIAAVSKHQKSKQMLLALTRAFALNFQLQNDLKDIARDRKNKKITLAMKLGQKQTQKLIQKNCAFIQKQIQKLNGQNSSFAKFIQTCAK